MSVYLGQLGRLVELKCPASQQVSAEGDPSFRMTLEGRRIAQVSPGRARRTWQAQLSDASTPAEIAAVMSFINGEWGNGPFVFVSADAPVTNMLTPGQASCEPYSPMASYLEIAGPMRLPGEAWAGRSIRNTSPAANLTFGPPRAPVVPGGAVTASAYFIGAGAKCYVAFQDSEGSFISSSSSPESGIAGSSRRLHVTSVAPANAATCSVYGVGAVQGARPAITWTDGLLDWADGQGCGAALIHAASRDLMLASRDPRGGRYSNLSFTVSEVG